MKFLLHLLLVCLSTFVFGQGAWQLDNLKVSSTKAILLGKTKPVAELKRKLPTNAKTKAGIKKQKEAPPNFFGRGNSNAVRPELEHQGPDPIRQDWKPQIRGPIVQPRLNFDGLTNDFGSPHDPTGDVGQDHYIQIINATTIGVYDKNGNLEESFAANTLWEPLGASSLGDPIVLYDHENDQWLITEFDQPASLLIAVSETSDPLGSYFVYEFNTPNFPDYPKYSIWSNAIVVTTNEEGPASLHQYFLERGPLMSGSENVTIQRVEIQGNTNTEAGFYVTTPVHWLGNTAPADDLPIAVKINDSSWGQVDDDIIEVFTFDVDFDNPDNTTVELTEIVTTPFDSYPCNAETPGTFACIAQGGVDTGLDAIPEVIMNIPSYRNFGTHETIVLNFITDVTDGENLSGIRWVELRKTPGNDWALYQEGTYAPNDGLNRYMGATAIDADGNIALGFSVSNENTFAGLRFTGRQANDPLGVMTFNEITLVEGTNPIETFRYGDYAHMSVDPVDGRTFWFTSEYAGNGTDNSITRIASFILDRRDFDLEVTSLSSLPDTSSMFTATESVTVQIANNGLLEANNFSLTLFFQGDSVTTETVGTAISAGDTLDYTFSPALDLSEVGSYELKILIDFPQDEEPLNDSLTFNVRKISTLDASIAIDPLQEFICSDSIEVSATITNEGSNVINQSVISIFFDDVFLDTLIWNGSLAFGESDVVQFKTTGLTGSNELTFEIDSVNGVEDIVEFNNSDSIEIIFDSTLEGVTLILNTDNFPDETTWQITDSLDNVLFSGGPYPGQREEQIFENFCLPDQACYTFTIFDSFGDGICCGPLVGNGSYSLVDGNGITFFESSGEFDEQESVNFCLDSGIEQTNDASVAINDALKGSEQCNSPLEVVLTIENTGFTTITSVEIEILLNENPIDTLELSSEITAGNSDQIIFPIEPEPGEQKLVANIISVNGIEDDISSNNTDSASFLFNAELLSVALVLETDDFPEEITWQLTDSLDNILFSGGPYPGQPDEQIIENFCLPDNACYTFTIFDSAEDGICCGFGEGSYLLIDADGEIIFESDGIFESQQETEFCVGCNLEVTIAKTDQGPSTEGSITITATGGDNIMYSIDGGATFSSSGVFENLAAGSYDVVVTSDGGVCIFTETVTIESLLLSTEASIIEGLTFGPNPTEGLFKVYLTGHNYIDGFLTVEVIDINGRVIQTRKFSRYDNTFEGTISLYAYPSGLYFLRLVDVETKSLIKVIRE